MIIPIPNKEENFTPDERIHAHVRWYMNIPPWKCQVCGMTMHGRMEYCVYCKLRNGVDTRKP